MTTLVREIGLQDQGWLNGLMNRALKDVQEMKTVHRKGQWAVLRKRINAAEVIVAIRKSPDGKGFVFSFVRGRGLNEITDRPLDQRVMPIIAMNDAYVSLWHLVYGESVVAVLSRRELAKADKRAHDRMKDWLVPHLMTTFNELAAKAVARPDDPDIAPEIHAAVRLSQDIRMNDA